MNFVARVLTACTLPLMAAGILACDSTGPDVAPSAIEITGSRSTLDLLEDTVILTAAVRTRGGDALPAAVVSWQSHTAAVATVDAGLVTARSNGSTWIVASSDGARDSVRITVDSPIDCAITATLVLPDTMNGALTTSDCQINGFIVDAYRFALAETTEITVQLKSEAFDPILYLLDHNGSVMASDDDGAGNLNSRISRTLNAGVYFLYASSYSQGETGSYEITLIEGVPPSPCPATAVIGFPGVEAGVTDEEGCIYNGFYLDSWRVVIPSDTLVTFQVDSEELLPALMVTDTTGGPLAGVPSNGIGTAWLEGYLEAGSYDIWVGDEAEPGRSGSYTLAVRPGPTVTQCPSEGPIEFAGTVAGTLTAEDCFLMYSHTDAWELELTDATPVTASVAASGFVATAMITNVRGETVGYFHGEHDTEGIQLEPGSYRVWVLSDDGAGGDYTLSVNVAGQMPACDADGSVALDDTVTGALSSTDCVLSGGRYADMWTTSLDETTTVRITLDTDKFDAYLIVADSMGIEIGADDDGGSGANAALTLTLDAGLYQIWATSYSPESLGEYSLAVSPTAGTGSAIRRASGAAFDVGKLDGREARGSEWFRNGPRGLPIWLSPRDGKGAAKVVP